MTDTVTDQPLTLETASREELLKVCQRDRFIKEMLTSRIASLTLENIELLAIAQQQQGDLLMLQQGQQTVEAAEQFAGNGPMMPNVAQGVPGAPPHQH